MDTSYSAEQLEHELAQTSAFAQKVNARFGFVPNIDNEINKRVIRGLAHNKLIYNKRYCPCFMVDPEGENRICPCKPALVDEIPTYGTCHCGLFCTPDYVAKQNKLQQPSKSLSLQEAKEILELRQLPSYKLEALLKVRDAGLIDFVLIDVRETIEYQMGHIIGTDIVFPTSGFYAKHQNLEIYKKTPIILYCMTGSRSFQVQRLLESYGYEHVCNLKGGISEYTGECQSS